ncbi:MAG TPA: hypothetical protein VIB79_25535 [Candidatus Binatia bacterium]
MTAWFLFSNVCSDIASSWQFAGLLSDFTKFRTELVDDDHASALSASRATADPFVADVARMLLTFLSVAAIDIVVISFLSHRLRFWFPLWLDPYWNSHSDSWVVYSQSYFAGIFMLPLLCRVVDRDFVAAAGIRTRGIFWLLCLVVFGFVLSWKASLMLEYHKYKEVLGWAALTGVIWTILGRIQLLPTRFRGLTRRQMLKGLLFGISVFFLIMSILDPAVQLGFWHLPWSMGLAIEVGFSIPAGVVLMALSRRMRI